MSSGAIFALGFVVGVLLTSVVFVSARSRLRPPPHVPGLVAQVSEETGWNLKRVKAVVDTLPRNRRRDDGSYYLG
jgi:hypothetical protein